MKPNKILRQHIANLIIISALALLILHIVLTQAMPKHELQNYNNLVSNNSKKQSNKLISASSSSSGGANQNRCQSGWMWFNNKCWVTTQSRRAFASAVELCDRMYNSTLPTIHSEDENEFLRQNIDLTNSPIWLFARHNHQYNRTRWLDKSPVNYTRWDLGQPSDKSSLVCIETEEGWFMKKTEPTGGQTECVSFWADAKWGTQVGCTVLLPVVCEKKLTPISRLVDSPNGSSISMQQYEQQLMAPLSGAQLNAQSQLTMLICSLIVSASLIATSCKLGKLS